MGQNVAQDDILAQIAELQRNVRALQTSQRDGFPSTQAQNLAANDTRSLQSYGDLDNAGGFSGVGPSVAVPLFGATGKMLIIVSVQMTLTGGQSGYASFEIRNSAGALMQSAMDGYSASASSGGGPVDGTLTQVGLWIAGGGSGYFALTLPTPDTYTVTMKYKEGIVGTAAQFSNRSLVVMPL